MGLKPVTTAEMEEFALLMRRLFRGEIIGDYHGPTGRVPVLLLDPVLAEIGAEGLTAACGRLFATMAGHHATYVHDMDAAELLE